MCLAPRPAGAQLQLLQGEKHQGWEQHLVLGRNKQPTASSFSESSGALKTPPGDSAGRRSQAFVHDPAL